MNRIVSEMRNNPNITTMELIALLGLNKIQIKNRFASWKMKGIKKTG